MLGICLSSDINDEIIDVIPLSHSYVLTPLIELALIQMESYAKKQNLHICGIYTCENSPHLSNNATDIANLLIKTSSKNKKIFIAQIIYHSKQYKIYTFQHDWKLTSHSTISIDQVEQVEKHSKSQQLIDFQHYLQQADHTQEEEDWRNL